MAAELHDRFSPRGTLSAEKLKAYAEGRLDAAASHDVEMHLEADPLLRDAAEGLQRSGALVGLDNLAQQRPGDGGSAIGAWLIGGLVIVGVMGITVWWHDADRIQRITGAAPPTYDVPSTTTAEPEAAAPLAQVEIEAAVEIPETLLIGHAPTDRHTRAVAETPVVERTLVDRVVPHNTTIANGQPAATEKPLPASHHSIQLMFLHDLKLVDPKELYATAPLFITEPDHVPASYADGSQKAASTKDERRMRYTPFMDAALEKFVQNDHKGCLEELRFLLAQYPDDVNALFYAGLCCYNLGLNERAREFLHRAATHRVDVFDEEAVWYHALTLERLGELQAAQEVYQRIASQGGFYAERATDRLSTK